VASIDLQYDLANETPANASPVEANFNRVEQHINTELIERDGTVAMRQPLRLSGDPVSALDAATKAYVDAVMPVGIIMLYGGATVPPVGTWLLCDNAEYSQGAYPALFAVIAQTYGGAVGTFRTPPINQGRIPIGTGGTPSLALGATGGTRDAVSVAHSHTASSGVESASHVHAGIDHLHSIGAGNTAGQSATHFHMGPSGSLIGVSPGSNGQLNALGIGGGPTVGFPGGTENASGDHSHAIGAGATGPADRSLITGGNNVNHTHAITVNSDGVTGVGANMPPYVAMTYIIRAA